MCELYTEKYIHANRRKYYKFIFLAFNKHYTHTCVCATPPIVSLETELGGFYRFETTSITNFCFSELSSSVLLDETFVVKCVFKVRLSYVSINKTATKRLKVRIKIFITSSRRFRRWNPDDEDAKTTFISFYNRFLVLNGYGAWVETRNQRGRRFT